MLFITAKWGNIPSILVEEDTKVGHCYESDPGSGGISLV
jgi:hypothetical protein